MILNLSLNLHYVYFLYPLYLHHRDLHSFPTRRSSDLGDTYSVGGARPEGQAYLLDGQDTTNFFNHGTGGGKSSSCPDRKSTRLNSSHTVISYAVFCLKKKKISN